jgi:catechol 2,3-dioxygenase-like lactoylglutathione lyase family enzyme
MLSPLNMKNLYLSFSGIMVSLVLGFFLLPEGLNLSTADHNKRTTDNNSTTMKLGAFSISLNVKDLKTSKAFYEKLGFKELSGSFEQNYFIMKNEKALIGLFQGMFEGNILTFNPGWDENGSNLETFEDIREIQKQLKLSGLELNSEADEKSEGPASLVLMDPDGNVILMDQHR